MTVISGHNSPNSANVSAVSTLDFSGSTVLTNNALLENLRIYKTPKLLNVSNCTKLFADVVIPIAQNYPQIQALDIHHDKKVESLYQPIAESTIENTIQTTPHSLLSLNLENRNEVQGQLFRKIMSVCSKSLLSLDISGCPIEERDLRSMITPGTREFCPKLEELYVQETIGVSAEWIQKMCQQLKELQIFRTQRNSYLHESSQSFINFPKLSSSIEVFDTRDFLFSIGNDEFLNIFSCINLRELRIKAYFFNISDDINSRIDSRLLSSPIEDLQIESINLTDDILSSIITCCKKLQTLTLIGCHSLTVHGIKQLSNLQLDTLILQDIQFDGAKISDRILTEIQPLAKHVKVQ